MSSHNNITSNITKQVDQTCCNNNKRADHAILAQSDTNTFPVWGVDTAASLLSGLPKPLPNYSNDSLSDRRNDVAQIDRMKEALTCLVGWTKAAPATASGNTNKSNISSNFCKGRSTLLPLKG